MDRFEHCGRFFHLPPGSNGEYIPEKVNCAALEPGIRKGFIDSFQQPPAFVADEQLRAGKPPAPEAFKELLSAGLVLFHPLKSADYLPEMADRPGDTFVPQSASVISSNRRTETPARYISIRASSTELSRRLLRSCPFLHDAFLNLRSL